MGDGIGKAVHRFPFCKHCNNMITAPKLLEQLDLTHAPLGFLKPWGTDHNEKLRLSKGLLNIVVQTAGAWLLVHITEDPAYLFSSKLGCQLRRNTVIFQHIMKGLCRKLVISAVPVADKGRIFPVSHFIRTSHSFVKIQISRWYKHPKGHPPGLQCNRPWHLLNICICPTG